MRLLGIGWDKFRFLICVEFLESAVAMMHCVVMLESQNNGMGVSCELENHNRYNNVNVLCRRN